MTNNQLDISKITLKIETDKEMSQSQVNEISSNQIKVEADDLIDTRHVRKKGRVEKI